MICNEYEIVTIIRPDIDDAVTYGLVEKFEGVVTDHGGHILVRDDWGKRKLAYPISKHLKGHYVLLSFVAPADLILELERNIRIQDDVIRFLTVKIADAVDVQEKLELAAEERKVREAAARARAAEEPMDDDTDDVDVNL